MGENSRLFMASAIGPKWAVVAALIVWISLGQQIGSRPAPPKTTYDAKRDVTIYSTGDVRTAGYTGYGAQFEFPGKVFSMPLAVTLGFGALRLTHGRGPEHDQESLHWNGVESVTIVFGSQALKFPAKHDFVVSTNRSVTTFLGRGLEESLVISMTPDALKQIAASEAVEVQLGQDKQAIKGKSLVPLKKLAATLAAS
jgi:hypothetical protein